MIKKLLLLILVALVLYVAGCASKQMCYIKIEDPLMQVNEDQDIDLSRIEDGGSLSGTSEGGCPT